MKVAVYSTKSYDQHFLHAAAIDSGHELVFFDTRLSLETVSLSQDCSAVCAFVNDDLGSTVLLRLAEQGIALVALRCAGFNNVDLNAAQKLGITVTRVPAYSPHAVAEHTVAIALALNRHIHRAFSRVRDGNFALDGLLGFDFHGRTVGVIGTGKIGYEFAKIMTGFGCDILAFDVHPNPDCVALGVKYLSLPEIFQAADIVSLHCPLTPDTHHLIDDAAIEQMKEGVMIINTSRGAVIDTNAVIRGLKRGKIGRLGLDVYEEEADFFFEDLSNRIISDDTLARLLTFPNVLITGHQAFFTEEALSCIAETTITSLNQFERNESCAFAVDG